MGVTVNEGYFIFEPISTVHALEYLTIEVEPIERRFRDLFGGGGGMMPTERTLDNGESAENFAAE